MQKCFGKPSKSIILNSNKSNDLKIIINDNSIEFLDFIYKLGINISNNSTSSDAQYTSTTILTLKTRCFKVKINEKFAKITALE